MIKVSIIVPVYNVEKYLERCLNSLINQTLDNIEIIVVNDGTKDNSQLIIDKFVQMDSRVKSYIKLNGGLSDARNYGLKFAKGEYIGFVDSDDYVDFDMFRMLYEKAKEKEFDMVVCDLNYVFDDKIVFCSSKLNKDLYNKKQIKEKMVNIYPTAWNKIYKKKIIEKFEFTKGIWYEDVDFLYRILPKINLIGVVKEPLYQYVQREGAITSVFNEKLFDYIKIWDNIVKTYKKNNIYNEYKNELEYCYVKYLYATMIKGLIKSHNEEMLLKGIEQSIKKVNMKFPDYKKNKYINKISFKNLYLLLFETNMIKKRVVWWCKRYD